MSALRSLAYGLVTLAECSEYESVELKRAARRELDEHHLWIGAVPQSYRCRAAYALTMRVGISRKMTMSMGKPLFVGSFEGCCDEALKRISPENYNPER